MSPIDHGLPSSAKSPLKTFLRSGMTVYVYLDALKHLRMGRGGGEDEERYEEEQEEGRREEG